MTEKIQSAICKALDEVNMMRPLEQALAMQPGTELTGDRGLESLELVNFVVQLEQYLEASLGQPVVLVQEGMDFQDGTFNTVATLADFIESGL